MLWVLNESNKFNLIGNLKDSFCPILIFSLIPEMNDPVSINREQSMAIPNVTRRVNSQPLPNNASVTRANKIQQASFQIENAQLMPNLKDTTHNSSRQSSYIVRNSSEHINSLVTLSQNSPNLNFIRPSPTLNRPLYIPDPSSNIADQSHYQPVPSSSSLPNRFPINAQARYRPATSTPISVPSHLQIIQRQFNFTEIYHNNNNFIISTLTGFNFL